MAWQPSFGPYSHYYFFPRNTGLMPIFAILWTLAVFYLSIRSSASVLGGVPYIFPSKMFPWCSLSIQLANMSNPFQSSEFNICYQICVLIQNIGFIITADFQLCIFVCWTIYYSMCFSFKGYKGLGYGCVGTLPTVSLEQELQHTTGPFSDNTLHSSSQPKS
jgi:hypothetical protein